MYFKAGSQQWLEERRKYLTATEVPVLLGLNSYRTLRSLVQDKLGHKLHAVEDNDNMKAGRRLEPAVIQAVNEELGHCVAAAPQGEVLLINHPGGNRIACSPDAFLIEKEYKYPVECKTTESMLKTWDSGKYPLSYLTQLLVQMIILREKKGYLAIMDKKDCLQLLILEVKHDKWLEAEILHEAQRFWESLDLSQMFKRDQGLIEKIKALLPTLTTKVFSSVRG